MASVVEDILDNPGTAGLGKGPDLQHQAVEVLVGIQMAYRGCRPVALAGAHILGVDKQGKASAEHTDFDL